MEYVKNMSKYSKQPAVGVKNVPFKVEKGWEAICHRLNREISSIPESRKILVIETYQGVIHEELVAALRRGLIHDKFVFAEDAMFPEEYIKNMVQPWLTNDRIFGFMSGLTMEAFFDPEKLAAR